MTVLDSLHGKGDISAEQGNGSDIETEINHPQHINQES